MKRFLLFVICYLSTWTANAQEGHGMENLIFKVQYYQSYFTFLTMDVPWILRLKGQGAKGIRAEQPFCFPPNQANNLDL